MLLPASIRVSVSHPARFYVMSLYTGAAAHRHTTLAPGALASFNPQRRGSDMFKPPPLPRCFQPQPDYQSNKRHRHTAQPNACTNFAALHARGTLAQTFDPLAPLTALRIHATSVDPMLCCPAEPICACSVFLYSHPFTPGAMLHHLACKRWQCN